MVRRQRRNFPAFFQTDLTDLKICDLLEPLVGPSSSGSDLWGAKDIDDAVRSVLQKSSEHTVFAV